MSDAPVDYAAKLRAAAAAMQKQQATIARLEAAQSEPIAIVGIGCRFPGGADDPASFWQMLRSGVDAIREIPADRWPVDEFFDANPDALGKTSTRWGGFLDDVDKFDARFFRISPREAVSMDPQQRLLLEVSWSALENGGIDPASLLDTETGVFVGLTTLDYAKVIYRDDVAALDTYCATGNVANVASGRLSYFYGLRGPSLTVDTACSSSLVAVHLACQSLRSGESQTAIAAGVNLMLAPDNTIAVSRAHMLSPDGRCKTFDRSANGYARSEGCGVVVLKRLSAAQADGNRIIAVIRGSAVRQDGARSGLTVPNGPAQERVIRAGLQAARVKPNDVSYVEAHGTGTSLGDPIEAEAIANVFREERAKSRPLVIGALKTNLGHMESAAGVGGIIKTALALEHAEIPKHLHLDRVHADISFDDIPGVVPTKHQAWPAGYKSRIAGVSSFGSSGTVAHVVMEAAPASEAAREIDDTLPCIVPISAASASALETMRQRYVAVLSESRDPIVDIAHTAGVGRAHFLHRRAVVAVNRAAAIAQLSTSSSPRARVDDVVFVCGAEAIGDAMARRLFDTVPVFRRAVEACHATAPALNTDTAANRLQFTRLYALAVTWKSWGIEPRAVIGAGIGELVAACVMGEMTLDRALQSVDSVSLSSSKTIGVAPSAENRAAFIVLGTSAEDVQAVHSLSPLVLASLSDGGDSLEQMLKGAAALYEAGCSMNWAAIIEGRNGRRVLLPTYAFERERFWPVNPAAAKSSSSAAGGVQESHAGRTALEVRHQQTSAADLRIRPPYARSSNAMRFGIMFFNGSEAAEQRDNYRLLLDSARFADARGFSSVWIPERHFTKFGSLYPNPATVHASLARETSHLRLMAGSSVLPLHNLLRLAEEWAVVDNMSSGRVGMSFASGWNPDDFALNPSQYADRQEALFRGVEQLRALWKGDAVEIANGTGAAAKLRTYPSPVQRELPLWITAASNPKTFERAGSIGANLLTHLLDHDVDELAAKIDTYRRARAANGYDAAAGQVTVMLHTFIGTDIDAVHAKVREPYCKYLKENIHLLKGLAVARGNQLDLSTLSPEDLDGFVSFLYDRFFSTRALLGTVESCAPLVHRLRAAGVNEIACLLDFGPTTDDVLESLPALEDLLRATDGDEPRAIATTSAVAAAPPPKALTDHVYAIDWPARPAPHRSAARLQKRFAVIADAGGVGAALVDRINAAGGHARIAAIDSLPVADEYIYLPHLDRSETEDTAAALNDAVLFVQSVTRGHATSRMWFATRGGQLVLPGDVPAPSHAALWAMLKVLPIERAQNWGGLVDLPKHVDSSASARALAEILIGDIDSDQLAIRADGLHAARLTRANVAAAQPLKISADASYLVTGGLSGLGLDAARWLVRLGAKHLLLAGRSAANDSAKSVIRELESAGASVRTAALDVTNRAAVAALAQTEPRIRGVVHAAGVWADRALADLSSEQLADVIAPKVDGTLALAEQFHDAELFIGFSAFSAMLPAETQGNYAAANAFLDAFIAGRHQQNSGWVSINWGPWSDTGFAITPYGRRAHERLESIGISRIHPRDGFATLDALMSSGQSGLGVMPVDWPRLFERDPNARLSPLLRDLSERHAPAAAGGAGRVRDLLAGLHGQAEITRLETELTAMASSILRLSASEIDRSVSFTDLGVDSLMAVELKNRIRHETGVDVPLVKLLEGPSIAELALIVSAHLKIAGLNAVVPSGNDLKEIEI